MPQTTTNFSFYKPLVADAIDEDLWGGYLNDNFDSIDTELKSAQDWAKTATIAKTSAYTVVSSDRNKTILCDATSAAFTITLPDAATIGDGFMVKIKKVDSSTNAVTVDGDASETIDGETTFSLSYQYDSIIIICDGSEWHILSKSNSIALRADVEAETAGKVLDANIVKYHNLVPKAWGYFVGTSGSTAKVSGYNFESVSRSSTGTYIVTFTNAMDDTDYAVIAMGGGNNLSTTITMGNTVTKTTTQFSLVSYASSVIDSDYMYFVVYGVLS